MIEEVPSTRGSLRGWCRAGAGAGLGAGSGAGAGLPFQAGSHQMMY